MGKEVASVSDEREPGKQAVDGNKKKAQQPGAGLLGEGRGDIERDTFN